MCVMSFVKMFAHYDTELWKSNGFFLYESKTRYRKVHSDGPPVSKLDRLKYPLFNFDIEKYGLQIINQGVVNHLNAIFINIKVK